MGGYGKYREPKVRPGRKSNEYGGRHRAALPHHNSGGQTEPDVLQELVALYLSAKETVQEFSPEIKFFKHINTIKPKGSKPTADEGKVAVNYLLSGINNIIKKHTKFDLHIPHVEESGLLMKAMRGSEKHNNELADLESQVP